MTSLAAAAAAAGGGGDVDGNSVFAAPNPSTERGAATSLSCGGGGVLAYGSGSHVVLRKAFAQQPQVEVYSQHSASAQVRAAAFSPNGNYVASGDSKGRVRVWAADHPERLLVKETLCLAGEVAALSWGPEGKRLAVAGRGGKGLPVKCILAATGSGIGEMIGQTKTVLGVAFKPSRPFRVASCGEDFKCCLFAGPPFAFARSHTDHSNFANAVAYSPDGKHFATAGSDRKVFLYEGKDGDKERELTGHEGGVFALAWRSDGALLASASADKTVKLWNAETGECVATLAVSENPQLEHMLVGLVWPAEDTLVAVALSGDLVYLDATVTGAAAGAAVVKRVVQGHQGAVVSMARNPANGTILTGSAFGDVILWDSKGVGRRVCGARHSSQAMGVAFTGSGDGFASVGWDDTVRFGSGSGAAVTYTDGVSLGSQPIGLGSGGGITVAATARSLKVFDAAGAVSAAVDDLAFAATSVAVAPGGDEFAVGCSDNVVRRFGPTGEMTGELATTGSTAAITALAYSPDGRWLAAGDAVKEVRLWDLKDGSCAIKNTWVHHSSRIQALAFSADSAFLASGSLDSHIYVWSLAKKRRKTALKLCHQGGVTGVAWTGADSVISSGADGCLRTWRVKLPGV